MDHSSFTGSPAEGVELLGMELLGIPMLEDHARRLAALFSLDRRTRGHGRAHLKRLDGHRRTLRVVYTELADDARRGEPASPAAEWLLDNFHIISSTARDIHHDLPSSFFRRLPTIATDEFAGSAAHLRAGARADPVQRGPARRPAAAALHHSVPVGHAPDDRRALGLAERAQARAHRASARQSGHAGREPRRSAWTPTGWPARSKPRSASVEWPAGGASGVRQRGCCSALARVRSSGGRVAPAARCGAWAHGARRSKMRSALKASTRRPSKPSMANLIGSLRLISTFDWSEFFESVSLVEQVLQRDPAGVYGRMDFRSRDRYRHAVEELAEPTGDGQLRVALKSVERARQVAEQTPDARGAHVGYHLIGGGRRQFEQSIALAARDLEAARPAALLRATRRRSTSGTIARRHGAARRGRGGLRACARLARRAAGRGRAAGARAGQRADHPDPPADRSASLIPPRRLPRLELDARARDRRGRW